MGSWVSNPARRAVQYRKSAQIKPQSRKISFAYNLFISYPIVSKFCTKHSSNTAVQKFKTIGQLKWVWWTNEISRDLILRWFSDGYLILHSIPGWSHKRKRTRALCCMEYPSDTHVKLKSREISFVHSMRFCCPIVLKSPIKHDSVIAMHCAIFQNDWVNKKYSLCRRNLARFEFKGISI